MKATVNDFAFTPTIYGKEKYRYFKAVLRLHFNWFERKILRRKNKDLVVVGEFDNKKTVFKDPLYDIVYCYGSNDPFKEERIKNEKILFALLEHKIFLVDRLLKEEFYKRMKASL